MTKQPSHNTGAFCVRHSAFVTDWRLTCLGMELVTERSPIGDQEQVHRPGNLFQDHGEARRWLGTGEPLGTVVAVVVVVLVFVVVFVVVVVVVVIVVVVVVVVVVAAAAIVVVIII